MNIDEKRLKKLGWTKTIINEKEWFIDPATQKKYRLSHALIVQDEIENQENIKHARLERKYENVQAAVFENFDALDHDVNDVWPKFPKAHARLRYCTNKMGCVCHQEVFWCGKHYHYCKPGTKNPVCPKIILGGS